MNKDSKMKSGWLYIPQNEKQLDAGALQKYVNNVARIRMAYNALANRKEAKRKHKECGQKRMREDEHYLQNLIACMFEFDSYSFDPASPTLRTLQSTMPALPLISLDLAAGEVKLTNFLQE